MSNGGTYDYSANFGSMTSNLDVGITIYNTQGAASPLYLTGSPNIQMSGGGAGFIDLMQPNPSINPITTIQNQSAGFYIGNILGDGTVPPGTYSATFKIPTSDASTPFFTFTFKYTYAGP